jgi:uncharacterized membrane protein YesL
MTFKTPKVFQGIFDNWKHDWRHNQLLFWLELVGTIGCVIAASSLALLAPNPNLVVTYCAYLVGSSALMVSSYMRNNGWWVVLNAFFMLVDIIGLYNTLKG